ncbi:MAG: PAC2 family protein [Ktedonobacterales bacterium]
MKEIQFSETPDLQSAVLIGAFAGWNDAAAAATWAIKFLIHQWDARPFAEIEPERFYDFTETRPKVRVRQGALKQVVWPSNRFYVHRAPRGDNGPLHRDIVLFLGTEPQLRWKTFCHRVVEVCRQCQVEEVALLGALVADVPHTLPAPISGTSGETTTLRRMTKIGVEHANYEGVSGILAVLQHIARKSGFSTSSLWGAAPHYVSATPNLRVSQALLAKLNALYDFDLRLDELTDAVQGFTQRVSALVDMDPEVSAYVRELELRNATNEITGTTFAGDTSGVHRIPSSGDLPSPEQAIEDVEQFLRQFRPEGGAES